MRKLKCLSLAAITLLMVNCSQSRQTEDSTSTNSPNNSASDISHTVPTLSNPSNPSLPSTLKVAFHSGAPDVSGTRANFKLKNKVYFSSDDWTKEGNVFVALKLANGELFFSNSSRQWTKLDQKIAPAPFFSGKVPETLDMLIAQGEDISDALYNGAILYIGYGLSKTSAEEAFKEMTANERYVPIYNIL
jgi:hypothetical protein